MLRAGNAAQLRSTGEAQHQLVFIISVELNGQGRKWMS